MARCRRNPVVDRGLGRSTAPRGVARRSRTRLRVRHAPRALRGWRLGPARPRGFMKPVLVRCSSKGLRQMAFDFERLEVFQKATSLIDEVYRLTQVLPASERFGLVEQLRRAAVSIALNIAEGSGRTKRDFRHFLRNARASCYEWAAVLQISSRLGYSSDEAQNHCKEQLVDVAKMISGLIRAIGGDGNEQ